MNDFSLTILSEAKQTQIQCLNMKGKFRDYSEAIFRMAEKIFCVAKSEFIKNIANGDLVTTRPQMLRV